MGWAIAPDTQQPRDLETPRPRNPPPYATFCATTTHRNGVPGRMASKG